MAYACDRSARSCERLHETFFDRLADAGHENWYRGVTLRRHLLRDGDRRSCDRDDRIHLLANEVPSEFSDLLQRAGAHLQNESAPPFPQITGLTFDVIELFQSVAQSSHVVRLRFGPGDHRGGLIIILTAGPTWVITRAK